MTSKQGYAIRVGYTRRPVSWHAWRALVDTMRVNDIFRKSVVFIGYREERDEQEVFVPCGTAFLVSSNVTGHRFDHLVTAAHNIEALRNEGKIVAIRVNQKGLESTFVASSPDQWTSHDDPTVDVAVLPVRVVKTDVEVKTLDVTPIPLDDWIVNDDIAEKLDLMAGAPIATIGLFRSHIGQEQNIPIVRQGHIATLRDPANPVATKRGYMDAHLVEVRSLGGLSGSPVFLMTDPYWIDKKNSVKHGARMGLNTAYLLGLMHGHFVLADENDIVREADDEESGSPDELNAGIGVVVPVEKIIETIGQMELKEQQMAAAKAINAQSKVREDRARKGQTAPLKGGSADKENEPNPNHRADLKRLLGAAAKSPKSSG